METWFQSLLFQMQLGPLHNGAFLLRLFLAGRWRAVVVDPNLPVSGRDVHSRVSEVGYMDHTGCHQLLFWLSLPGVRLVTWNILAVIN
jgi:hypothetical protein